MRIISLVLILLLIIVGIAFAALNAQHVKINYLIGQTEFPLAGLLLISLIVGILISILLLGSSMIKLKAQNKWLQNKVKRIQDS